MFSCKIINRKSDQKEKRVADKMINKVKVYKSFIDEKIFNEFKSQRGDSLFNHSANSNYIDDFISVAYVLCPDIIDVNDYIFIADFFKSCGEPEENELSKLRSLEKQHNNDKKKVEQWVNSWGFGSFFIGKDCESMDNEKILLQFGEILVYYWSKRVKELFPERNIIVEYGEKIMGEEGLTITLYEA